MVGEILQGYRLEGPFRVSGGGQCEWTFAEKDGKQYFIKKFLEPKFPVEGSPGSAGLKEFRLRRCEEFEMHQRSVLRGLRPLVGSGGNLVVPTAFFRVGTAYYKASERVVSNVALETVAGLPPQEKIIVLLTVVASLRALHSENLVHGDIKPANILITHSGDRYVSKLIDFDDCFRSGIPPEPESLVGDFKYYSPELGRYISNEEYDADLANALITKSDIFALGLVFFRYLTGCAVPLAPASRTAWQASNVGTLPRLATGLSPQADTLVNDMLASEPRERPTAVQVFDRLKDIQRDLRVMHSEIPDVSTVPLHSPTPGDDGTMESASDDASGRLQIKMSRMKPSSSSATEKTTIRVEPEPFDTTKPRILIKGLRSSYPAKTEPQGSDGP